MTVTRRLCASLLVVVVVVIGLGLGDVSGAVARAQPAGGNPLPGSGGVFELAWSGDISPPISEARGDDYGTSELALAGQPDGVATAGDNVYECGSPAAWNSPVGYHGSWGRVRGITWFPTLGNHDVCEPGPGAPSFRAYFAEQLADLPCLTYTNPCDPNQGYYDRDLDVNSDGQADWFIMVLASDCGRVQGATGDAQTPSCAANSPQDRWLNEALLRRYQKQRCSLTIWHHERWGTTTFGDDPVTATFYSRLNHHHNEVNLSGHAHSLARLGPMTVSGHLASTGAGQRQLTAGTGGRSRLPFRVNPAREGTRYRSNTNYAVGWLRLTATRLADGSWGGTWAHEFRLVGTDGRGTTADPTGAVGCWQ